MFWPTVFLGELGTKNLELELPWKSPKQIWFASLVVLGDVLFCFEKTGRFSVFALNKAGLHRIWKKEQKISKKGRIQTWGSTG